MKIQTFNRLAQTITLALVCSTTISAQAAIVIGAGVRNGDFNDETSATDGRSFADTPFWENIGTGDQSAQCTRLNNAYD